MPAAYRSHERTTYANRTDTTLNKPTGTVEGDELRLVFLLAASTVANIPTPTFPSGFSVLPDSPTTHSQDGSSAAFSARVWVLRKRAGSSEPADYTITHTAANSQAILIAARDAADDDGQVTVNPENGTGNVTALGITTEADGCLLIFIGCNWQNWGTGVVPTGSTPTFTERIDASDSAMYFAEGVLATAGATGNKTTDSLNTTAGDAKNGILISVEALPATVTIVDDGDAGFSTTGGGWTTSNVQGYQGDVRFAGPSGTGTNTAKWSLTGLTAGDLVLLAMTWSPDANRATNTPYTVYDSDGTTVIATGTINQELTPGSFTEEGTAWLILCRRIVSGTSIHIEITDNANEHVIADAVRFEHGPPSSAYTYSVVPDGDWTNSATWNNGVPTAGVTAVTLVPVTVDDDVTVENLEMDDGGTITVDDGFTFAFTGSVIQGNTPFILGAGSALNFDATTADVVWIRGTLNGQSNCKIIANGTANGGDSAVAPPLTTGGNHARIFKTGSNDAYFKLGSVGGLDETFFGTGGYELNWCEVEGLASSTGFWGLPLYSSSDVLALNCSFTNCGRLFGPPIHQAFVPFINWFPSGNSDFRFEYSKVTSSVTDEYALYMNGANEAGSGAHTLFGSGLYGSTYLNLTNGAIGVTAPNYFDECPGFGLAGIDSFGEGQVIRYGTNASTLVYPATNCYLLADNRAPGGIGNQHYIALNGPADLIGNVFENPHAFAIDVPDCFFGDLGPAPILVKGNLIIPSITDGTLSGCLMNPGSGYGSQWNVDFQHNTLVGINAQFIVMENFRGGDLWTHFRSNLIASPTLANALWLYDFDFYGVDHNIDAITPAENKNNWIHNGASEADPASSIVRIGYHFTRMTENPAGPNLETSGAGLDGDGPTFVAATRNAARYALNQSWVGAEPELAHTEQDWIDWKYEALDAFRDGLIADPRKCTQFRDWVRAGFAPTNPAADGTAHDAGTIGAITFSDGATGTGGAMVAYMQQM